MSTFAFIVGLENYQLQAKPIKSVIYAEADAKGISNALTRLGVPLTNQVILLNAQATKSALESRFKSAISALTENDAFIFFFAGHGLSLNDQNYITCHDTQRGDLAATSISLQWIFTSLRRTPCKHAAFFLDCCHSGLPIDDGMRGIADHVSETDFQNLFSNSEYHMAFAACKSDEFSYPSNNLSHGIWTYHVLRALNGEASEALDRSRYVTSNSLQNYLAQEVPRTLRTTVAPPARQTPCMFGNSTAQFIIADLKPILDTRQAALAAKTNTPADAAFVGTKYGSIRSLSGFTRFHKVPESVNSATQRFVAGICAEEIQSHANKILSNLRAHLKYGIKDIDRAIAQDSASLKTKDFDLDINISQCDDEPDTYALQTIVTNFRNPAIVNTPEFNAAIKGFVDKLELQLPPKLDLEDMISKLEKSSLKDSVSIDYDADLTNVTIEFDDTGMTLIFKNGVCEIATSHHTTPLALIDAVKETQITLMAGGSTTVPLLG